MNNFAAFVKKKNTISTSLSKNYEISTISVKTFFYENTFLRHFLNLVTHRAKILPDTYNNILGRIILKKRRLI